MKHLHPLEERQASFVSLVELGEDRFEFGGDETAFGVVDAGVGAL
jgi:hypothetical protein